MKIIMLILAFINGAYTFVDGIYVLLKDKYIGPEKPGPWANIFYKMNINVYKLGPLFIGYGFLWFVYIYLLYSNNQSAYYYGFFISLITLWYLPFGTVISIVIILLQIIFKQKIFL